jgi:hypothetical protein
VPRAGFTYRDCVIGFLRFIGLLNAGVWVGAAVFLVLVAEPALYSNAARAYLLKSHGYFAGALDGVIRGRFLYFNLVCGGIAMAHLLAEWLYLGRPIRRISVWLVLILVAMAIVNIGVFETRVTVFHEARYRSATPAARQEAQSAFERWRRASNTADLLMLGGLCFYLWSIVRDENVLRFVGAASPRRL